MIGLFIKEQMSSIEDVASYLLLIRDAMVGGLCMFYWLFFVDIGAYDWLLSNKLAVIVVINLINASLEFTSTHHVRHHPKNIGGLHKKMKN